MGVFPPVLAIYTCGSRVISKFPLLSFTNIGRSPLIPNARHAMRGTLY